MEKTVSYSLAVKGIGGGAVIYPHKIGVLETAKSRSLDLSTISGLLKKINFSVFTNLPSLPAGRLNCNETPNWICSGSIYSIEKYNLLIFVKEMKGKK